MKTSGNQGTAIVYLPKKSSGVVCCNSLKCSPVSLMTKTENVRSSGKNQNSIKDSCVPFLSSWKNKKANKQNVQCIRKGTLVDLTVHHRVQAAQ